MRLKNIDLIQLFAMYVKIFYNTAVADVWRMFIDLNDLHKKYVNQEKSYGLSGPN